MLVGQTLKPPKRTRNTDPYPKIIVLEIPEARHKLDPKYAEDIVDGVAQLRVVV